MIANRAHGCTGPGNNRGGGPRPLIGDAYLGFADFSAIFTAGSEKLTSFGVLTFFLAVRFGHMKYVRARTGRTRCAMQAKTL